LVPATITDANRWLELLEMVEAFPERHGEKIIENFSNSFVGNDEVIRSRTNELLKKHGMSPVPDFVQDTTMDDEIPF
jgi:hypothetical protein